MPLSPPSAAAYSYPSVCIAPPSALAASRTFQQEQRKFSRVFPALARITVSDDALATCAFNTGRARHHFCLVCGAAPFYIARSHPDDLDVNVRCIEGADLSKLTIAPFDGRNWESAVEQLREES